MNGLITRATLYDLLSMLIPGYLFLYLMKLIFIPSGFEKSDELTYYIAVFALSYIVGMAIHLFTKLIFRKLRNNPCIIKQTLNDFIKDHKLQIIMKDDVTTEYLAAYYKASKFSWSAIPTIEAQYSFLRSMVIIESLYLVFGNAADMNGLIFSIITIAFILTIILMWNALYNTSYRVWEDSYFTSQNTK